LFRLRLLLLLLPLLRWRLLLPAVLRPLALLWLLLAGLLLLEAPARSAFRLVCVCIQL
jgi:hypothetical protein